MDIDAERLIADYLWPALFAVLGIFAWLSIVAQRTETAKGLLELCRKAMMIRDGQEKLRAAGKAAPRLDQSRRLEADLRALLRRCGLQTAPEAVEPPRPPAARPAAPARR